MADIPDDLELLDGSPFHENSTVRPPRREPRRMPTMVRDLRDPSNPKSSWEGGDPGMEPGEVETGARALVRDLRDPNNIRTYWEGQEPADTGMRQDWGDASNTDSSKRSTGARKTAPRSEPEKPIFSNPEEARAAIKEMFEGKPKPQPATAGDVKSDKPEPWEDKELLAAMAQQDERTFWNNLQRAGITIGSALAGRKADYSNVDRMDEQAGRPVERLKAVRASERQHKTDVAQESKIQREADRNSATSAVSRGAQNAILAMDPSLKDFGVDKMSAAEIEQNFPMFKERTDAAEAMELAKLREKGDTDRTKISAWNQRKIAEMKGDRSEDWSAIAKAYLEKGNREMALKEGQLKSAQWESVDPGIVLDAPTKRALEGMTDRTMRVLDAVDGMERLFERHGGQLVPGSEGREDLQVMRTGALMDMQRLYENGVLSGDDLRVLETVLGDPNSPKAIVFGDAQRAQMRVLKSEVMAKLARKGESVGQRLRPRQLGSEPNLARDPRQLSVEGGQKRYSRSRNITQTLDASGKVVREEPGDTRRR